MNIGSFGFGSAKQRSSSSSSSSSFGQSQSSGFSQSGSTQSVFGADLFQQLFGGASVAAAGINSDQLTGTANRLFDSGAGFIDALDALGGAGPQGAGEQYLSDQLTGSDSLLAGELDAFKADLTDFYNETVMPGIRSDAIAVGALGGGRQGVAEGIAGKGLLQQFTQGAVGLRQNAQARNASIAQTLAQLQTQRRLSAAGAGLAALPQQYQLAEAGSLAALSPFMALAGILGGPTTLTDAFSLSRDQSSASEMSSSQSQSQGRSDQFQFSVGV